MGCRDCKEYTVSCRVLEGFECCKCCGIGKCEHDICPPEEKMPIRSTVYEFRTMLEISSIFNTLNKSKDAFLKGKFTRHKYHDYESTKNKLKKLEDSIPKNPRIREHVKPRLLKEVEDGLSSCRDLNNLILNRLGLSKKKGNFKYFKRNLDKFSEKTIGKISRLSEYERYKLLSLKGVNNPWIFIR